MVIDQEILKLQEYLLGTDNVDGAWYFALKAVIVLLLGALMIRVLVNLLRLGPGPGFNQVGREINSAAHDVAGFSFRRVVGLSRLAWREAMRKHVWIVLLVFLAILAVTVLLSNDDGTDPNRNPAKLLLTFVMSTSAYLVLFLGLFLSTFSLPNDIKQRTIYTVATKPVRAGEIVLGRILGFTAFGTVLLGLMAVVSYAFVGRMVAHTHAVASADLSSFDTATGIRERGSTSKQLSGDGTELENGHKHSLTLDHEGRGATDIVQGHRHYVLRDDEGNYEVGPPEDNLAAKVPVYGELRFKDPYGTDKERGISVGAEWTYRSFVAGGTLAAAIWKFDDITPERFPDKIRLDLMLRVFRTKMGEIEKGVEASWSVVNPKTGVRSAEQRFTVKEFGVNQLILSRDLEDVDGKPLDLFQDLVDKENGSLEIWVRSFGDEMYLGMAQADAYLRADDASYAWNFCKGYIGIWLQMVTVISFGVMFSTFLSGPIALMATIVCLMLAMGDVHNIEGIRIGMINETSRKAIAAGGSQKDYPMLKGEVRGGGPIESFIRIIRQQNLMAPLDIGDTAELVVKQTDRAIIETLYIVDMYLLPKLDDLSYEKYVAFGFDIPTDLIVSRSLSTAGFCFAMFAIGYFCLKTREIAK